MASSLIHLAVANEVNKVIKHDYKSILIGSIAPDISKHMGRSKLLSHFQTSDDDIPRLDLFLDKYKDNLDDDFVLGYYIHLYTDYVWFKTFLPEFIKGDYIYKLDGTKEILSEEKKQEYIYNDYTNINMQIIDNYKMDLSIFYEDVPEFKNIIKEIPMDKINLIIEKAGIIIENAKTSKAYMFDVTEIKRFINLTTEYILSNLKELGIID